MVVGRAGDPVVAGRAIVGLVQAAARRLAAVDRAGLAVIAVNGRPADLGLLGHALGAEVGAPGRAQQVADPVDDADALGREVHAAALEVALVLRTRVPVVAPRRVVQGALWPLLHVGLGLASAVVLHERDGQRIAAERRARQAQPHRRHLQPGAHAIAPRAVVTRVVHLVQHGEAPLRHLAHLPRALRHLLVGGDDPVHLRRNRLPAYPRRVQVQAKPLRRGRPLPLQVLGGRHHHQPPARMRGQVLAGSGQREGGLAGPGRGHRKEVLAGATRERIECALLPLTQADCAGDGSHRPGQGSQGRFRTE